MTYLDRLDRQLPPDPGGSTTNGQVADPAGVVPANLPRHLRRMLDEQPGDDRSGQHHALVAAAIEWGYEDTEVQALAAAHAPSREKYGNRLATETQRVIAKHAHNRGVKKAALDVDQPATPEPADAPANQVTHGDQRGPTPSPHDPVGQSAGSGAADDGDEPRPVHSPGDPLPNARRFLDDRYRDSDHRSLLLAPGGEFYAYNGRCWPAVDDQALRAQLYDHFADAVYQADGQLRRFRPNKAKIANLLDALRAACHAPAELTGPCWLTEGPVAPDELVAVDNGLLHLPSRTLHPHTPALFNHHAVPFAYDPHAPRPSGWLAFLDQLWGDDPECVAALQEWLGYLIAGDTSLHKMLLLVGPSRSGKGTIGRVLTALLGRDNVAGPTLSSLVGPFGLQPLINKPVALVSDARLSGRANQQALVERLLSISGEDTLTIDRKHRHSWTGQLPTRFVILTNELPRLDDTSGALASRFVTLTLRHSFYGHEDTTLTNRLLAELPGIFNWALDGLERLRETGRFTDPESSRQAQRELEDIASPVGAFVRERCHTAPDATVPVDRLWAAWKAWCTDHGRDHIGTKQTFARDLRAVVAGLTLAQPRDAHGRQYRAYQGLGLLTPMTTNKPV